MKNNDKIKKDKFFDITGVKNAIKKNSLDEIFWADNTWLTCEVLSGSGNKPHVLIVESGLTIENLENLINNLFK